MFILIMSAIVFNIGLSDWVLVDSSFHTGFTSSNNWLISKSYLTLDNAGTFSNKNCPSNLIEYVQLKYGNSRIDKKFIENSYQSEVIVDIFFYDALSSKAAQFQISHTIAPSIQQVLYQRSYKQSDLTQNAARICDSSIAFLDFFTIVGTSQVQQQQQFNISIFLQSPNTTPRINVRNLFVYVKYCLPTCLTCSSSTSCLTCYYGTPLEDGSCNCDPLNQFSQTGIGCRQECERDYFIARSDNICVPDRRIKSNVSYFETTTFSVYTPFQFIQDTQYFRSSPLLIYSCSSTSYVGSLLYNEGMSLQFANSQSLTFIRLRITFYIKNFLPENRIQIILDDQIQGEIIKTQTNYYFDKVTKISSSSVICSTHDLIRIEAILRTYSLTPRLLLKGSQLTQATSIWGFRNITVDIGICKENCLVCADFSTCQQCGTGYILYQNGCVISCPAHSTNCVDYADIIPYSRYLAKGFYNLNMSTSDINNFFDTTISTGSNFMTGQKFSIFPTKFVLGGVMVWNNAIYKKSWSISKPHYAITIRFNVTFGDGYSGDFYSRIQGVKSFAYSNPLSGGYNIIGRTQPETTRYFEIFQNPFLQTTLDIEFQCTGGFPDPRNEFCAISDYFIVVHYCPPFCLACTNWDSCSSWEFGSTHSNCLSNQFLYFDPTLETYSCITCNQPGCLTCKNLEECTSCDSQSEYNTLINGVCLHIITPPIQIIIQCNKYCETCTGTLPTNCQTCVSDYHRSILNNQCQCQSGYYDDGINLPCNPICGDFLVVYGEDCDDGNNYPYDGCHNCMFSCDEFCKQCIQGKCYDCQNGFQVVNDRCISICGDGIVVFNEQCDEGDITQDFGCQNCQFICQNECLSCIKGVCHGCQTPEWILDSNNNKCIQMEEEQSNVNICGDGILNIQIEECDDGNNQIRDGCDQCQLEKGFLCYYDENRISQGCTRCQDLNCLYCSLVNELQTCTECISGYFVDEFQQCSQCDLICIECSQNYKNCTTFNTQFTNSSNQHNYNCNLIQGIYDDQEFYECVLNCGNGILDVHEQCDDRNREISDGCDEFCQLEDGYLFDHITHSIQKEPYIQVKKKQSNNNQYSLLIDQYQEQLNASTLTVKIEGFSNRDYNYSVVENNNQFDFNFTYKKTIEPENLIHISISYKQQYRKRSLEEIFSKEIIIVPQRQVYVTDEQKLQGEIMALTYQSVFSAQIYLAPLAILFGGFKFFLALLDIMSWMNNFYFLNVNYPENVRIIFQQAEWSNIINLPSLHLLNKPTDPYYFQAPIKFVEKEVDPLLFNNLQAPIIFAFQVIFTYFLSVMFIKLVELIWQKKHQKIRTQPTIFQLGKEGKHEEFQKDSQLVSTTHLHKNLDIPKSFQSIFKKCVYIKSNLMANLIRSFSLSYLDITLAVMLQITNQQTAKDLIVKINIIAAFVLLIFVIYLLQLSYQISQAHKIKLKNTLYFSRYCCFYEEMKAESETAMAYSFVNLIRKTIFIVSTVILYFFPIFQTLLCFLSCLFNNFLLLSNNPYESKKQYILTLVPDFCINIIVGCTIIFAFQDRFKILNDESIYQIGWIVGICIYLSIGLQLMFLIYEILLSFFEELKSFIAYLKNKCITQKK